MGKQLKHRKVFYDPERDCLVMELDHGTVMLFDREDLTKLVDGRGSWCILKGARGFYAKRNTPRPGGGQDHEYAHRVVAGAKPGDYITLAKPSDGEVIDIRRQNILSGTRPVRRKH